MRSVDVLSIARIVIALLIAGAAFAAADTHAAVLVAFVVAAATDVLGEVWTRGHRGPLGSVLDSFADKALVYGVLFPLGSHGFPSLALLLPLIARDVAVIALRLAAARRGTELHVDQLGRLKTMTLYVGCTALLTLGWLQSGSPSVPSALAVPAGDLGVTLLYLGLFVLALLAGTLLSFVTLSRYVMAMGSARA